MPTLQTFPRWITVVAVAGVLLAACAGPDYMLLGSSNAPGAEGDIKIEGAGDGMRSLSIVLENLAPPDRLGEGMGAYVVWTTPEGGTPRNRGAANYDRDNRAARAVVNAGSGAFELKITAEVTADVVAPGQLVVATRKIAED